MRKRNCASGTGRRVVTAAIAASLGMFGLLVPAATDAADPDAFDVAGVRFGVGPAEVSQALAKSGYRIERTSTGETWSARLKREVGLRGGCQRAGRRQDRCDGNCRQRPSSGAIRIILWAVPSNASC